MADGQANFNWRVSDQQQTTRVTSGGRFEDVYEFTIDTGWGGTFKLQLPVLGFSPDTLQTLAQAEYEDLTAARFLSG